MSCELCENLDAMLTGRELAPFREQLLDWFRQFQRDLPWRRTKDPYRIWLSEIMLQQTRVAAAIPYYERFLTRFPDVQSLAAASEQEVLRFWSGLGYYHRARNLQKAARQIVAQHGGKFPEAFKEVLALPGIGYYTAAAILSIAFGKEYAVLDGNVARVLARLGAIRGNVHTARVQEKLQGAARIFLDPKSPGDWNQAVMELGATLCSPKSPQCLLCPVSGFCEARKLGIAETLPEKRQRRATVEVTLASAVFADKNGWTLLLPPPKGPIEGSLDDYIPILASNLWHFPTVSVNGDPAAKLRTHLRKLMPHAGSGHLRLIRAGQVSHTVTYRAITITPFRIGVEKLPRIKSAERVPLHNVTALPVSNLTRKVAQAALTAGNRKAESRGE